MAKVYWKDEKGVEHEVLCDRRGDYYYEDGDWDVYLDDEDLIELGLVEEEEEDGFDGNEDGDVQRHWREDEADYYRDVI